MTISSEGADTRSVLRIRDFRVLLATQGASSLGDAVSATAMPLLVLALTGSGLAMGIVSALHFLPDLFVGMVAGAIADRADRKRMMLLADLGRAGLTALIPLSVMLGGPTMVVILIVAIPLSVLRSFFMAGYTAAVPDLVGRSQIARANSLLEAVYQLGYIAGPAIAGILASTIGPGPTLAIDAASFALSGLGLRFLRRELRAREVRQEPDLVKEVREGVDFVRAHPILRSAILYWGVTSVITASFVTALAVHITRDLALPATILGLILDRVRNWERRRCADHGSHRGPAIGRTMAHRWQPAARRGLRGSRQHRGRAHADRDGDAGRDRAILCVRDLFDDQNGLLARCPDGTGRQHSESDLIWHAARRPARRWRRYRSDVRFDRDRPHGRWAGRGELALPGVVSVARRALSTNRRRPRARDPSQEAKPTESTEAMDDIPPSGSRPG